MRATDYLKLILFIIIWLCLIFIPSSAKNDYNLVYGGEVVATAYNSLPWQTDDSPWITASGTRCREGVIAANFLPFGTKVKIEGFGDQVFVVEDRMNRRYKRRIDIWMREYDDAVRFGVRKIKFYIIESA